MPAGRGKLCEKCYWENTCRKRVKMDQAVFATSTMQDTFGEFGYWLEAKVGPHKAALTIHRYLSFFLQIETEWKHIPTYIELLEHFTAEGLRRVRLPMQWLREARGVEPDPNVRNNDSERRRIQVLIDTFPKSSWAAQALNSYLNELMARHSTGRTSLRSVRLALRPAVSLLLAMDTREHSLPSQSVLDRYLLEAPGQKAAITGFIRFLQAAYGLNLVIRIDAKKTREARRHKLEQEIIQMARHPEEGDEFLRRWISVGLEYFHRVKMSKRTVQSATIAEDNDGLRVTVNGNSYFLPQWDTPAGRL